ncbi:MAG: hypothetical protein EXX96DRAFT_270988 [Benjaminiella poitrasii]|nr:MAG: hypothetical protein EXX96DRAFT_270988 [Benjaminiella poitrasii]
MFIKLSQRLLYRLLPPLQQQIDQNMYKKRYKILKISVKNISLSLLVFFFLLQFQNKSSIMKRLFIRLILITLVGSVGFSFWHCHTTEPTMLCKQVDHYYIGLCKAAFDQPWALQTKQWLDRTTQHYQFTQQVQSAYRWLETTSLRTAIEETEQWLRPIIYTSDDQIRMIQMTKTTMTNYILPLQKTIRTFVMTQLRQWRHHLDMYIESGSSRPVHHLKSDDAQSEDLTVEDHLRKTAKRILAYIDQLNEDVVKSGLKKEEAREKAQRMIESVTAIIASPPKEYRHFTATADSTPAAADNVAFEIQSIMDVATLEKRQLAKQLDLLQDRLYSYNEDEHDDEENGYFVHALKAEVEQLRAAAENSVRERTKLALERLQETTDNSIVSARMKENLQTAQRAALKELRQQIYIKLYETNKEIEQLL